MDNPLTIVGLLASGGVATWLGNLSLEWLRQRGHVGQRVAEQALELEKHRDNLTFQLLEAARTEIATLRQEMLRLRPMEGHLIHFEEALTHVEALLTAPVGEAREIASRNAHSFLMRVRGTAQPPANDDGERRITHAD